MPESHTIELDGHTDTHDTSVLWVADLKLVVAGDVVYSDVHQYFVGANVKELRLERIAALETVVAGHKRLGGLDSVADVHASIIYIRDFQALIDGGVREQEDLYQKVMEEYALARGCLKAVWNLE